MSKGRVRQETPEVVGTCMPMREFRKAALGGVFVRVVLESDWTDFRVRGEMANGVHAVLSFAREDHPRKFRNPAAALAELRKMGVTRVEVVMGEWDVEMATLSMRQRPDVTARRLRRKRMTYAEQMLEAAKTDPSLAAFVPPGTQEPGPVSREEEYRRLVDGKLEGLARKAREEDARAKAEWDAAEAEGRKNVRAWSDALIEKMENRKL